MILKNTQDKEKTIRELLWVIKCIKFNIVDLDINPNKAKKEKKELLDFINKNCSKYGINIKDKSDVKLILNYNE